MLDNTELRNHAEKDSQPFLLTGATSHDCLINKVWSCRSGIINVVMLVYHCCSLLLFVFSRKTGRFVVVMGSPSAAFPYATGCKCGKRIFLWQHDL